MRFPVVLAALGMLGISSLQARELQSSDIFPAEHPTVEAVAYMSRVLNQMTAGKLSIAVGPGDLDSELYSVSQLRIGVQDMARVNVSTLNGLVPATRVLSLPFLFRSQDHLRRTVDGPIGAEVLASLEPLGLVGLCFLDVGPRSLFSVGKPIRKPADLRGVRMSVQLASVASPAFRALGASPVAMPLASVAPSLEAGIIDASTGDWLSPVSTSISGRAIFMNLTEHSRPPGIVIVSRKTWNQLDAAGQESLREACISARKELRSGLDERLQETRKIAEEGGITVIDDVDKAAFEALLTPLYGRLLGSASLLKLARRIQDER
jgi:TRAP-type C4-dicarboxylate transport system substrate-binding protein